MGAYPLLQDVQETFGYVPPETIEPIATALNLFPSQVQGVGLEEGETSPDYQFTLETVACLGACFLAPTMMINRDYFGKLSPTKMTSVLGEYQKK